MEDLKLWKELVDTLSYKELIVLKEELQDDPDKAFVKVVEDRIGDIYNHQLGATRIAPGGLSYYGVCNCMWNIWTCYKGRWQ